MSCRQISGHDLQRHIDQLRRRSLTMAHANALIDRHGPANSRPALLGIGLEEEEIRQITLPDPSGRHGFPLRLFNEIDAGLRRLSAARHKIAGAPSARRTTP